MPAPSNSNELLDLVERSNLVDPAALKRALEAMAKLGGVPDAPAPLADALVRAGLITPFHSEQLLAGRHKGFIVGKYKVLDLIGAGGMGKVYLAEHLLMRRQVALKILPKTKSADPSALARFYREARAVAALDHRNIVRAFDIDKEGELHYIVMEFIDGLSVHDFVKQYGPISWGQAADYICQSCEGLDHANLSGLIHRDIKPGNLLIDAAGVIKLLDMGLAVFFEERDADPLTLAYDENVLGTADYLSPEQALDSHNVDIRADIYGLGCTMYFMLTGGPPFPEGTIAQKLLWHQNREPKPIEERVPEIPAELAAVLRKMMAKRAGDRYAHPLEARDAMQPFAKRVERPYEGKPNRGRRVGVSVSSNPKESGAAPAAPRRTPASGGESRPAGDPRPENAAPKGPASPRAPSKRGAIEKPAERPGSNPNFSAKPAKGKPATPTATHPDSRDPPKERRSPGVAPDPFGVARKPAPANAPGVSTLPPPAEGQAGGDEAVDFFNSILDSAVNNTTSIDVKKRSLAGKQGFVDRLMDSWQQAPPLNRMILVAALALIAISVVVIATYIAGAVQPAPKISGIGEPAPQMQHLSIVGRIKQRNYATLDEVLADAQPGETVLIQPRAAGPWEENSLQFRPTRIEGKNGVKLVGVGDLDPPVIKLAFPSPLLEIEDTTGLHFKNLILDGGGRDGPLVVIHGPKVEGLLFENVRIRNVRGVAVRFIGASGQPSSHIELRKFAVEGYNGESTCIDIMRRPDDKQSTSRFIDIVSAQFVGPFATGIHVATPVSELKLSDSYYTGPFSTALVFAAPVIGPVHFQHNLVVKGTTAVSLAAPDSRWDQVHVLDNTFQVDVGIRSSVGAEAIGALDFRAGKTDRYSTAATVPPRPTAPSATPKAAVSPAPAKSAAPPAKK